MTESKKYCMGCMKEIPAEETVCPHCSYNDLSVQRDPFLHKRSIIADRYLIGKVESFSSDSITYIGLDLQNDSVVSVTEFYPEKIVSRPPASSQVAIRIGYEELFRVTLQSFIDLWNELKEFSAAVCLPTVTDVLLYNGTAYAVSEYKDCITLESYFKERPALSPKKALASLKPIITTLGKLHGAGIVHGGISPKSVCVGSDGKLHLTRFSIKQSYSAMSEVRTRPTSGFTPFELYGDVPEFSTACDIYSITALIYYTITGSTPADATKRAVKDDMVLPSSVAEKMTKSEITALVKGMAVQPYNRLASVAELMKLLYADTAKNTAQVRTVTSSKVQAVPARTKSAEPKPAMQKKEPSGNNELLILMAKAFAGAIVGFGLVFSLLYATVLYKSVDIPVMDSLFSWASFLPMNKEDNKVVFNETPETTTTEPTSNYDRSYVSVPDFTVHTYDRIKSNEIFNRNFVIKYKMQPSKTHEKNTVISQSLAAGESVLSGTEITLVISEGIAQIELPDVIGMPYQAAKEKLEHAGFTVKKETTKNTGDETPDEVYLMSKVAGLEFDEGTEIVLSVWDEVEETTTEKETTTKKETNTKKETTTKKPTTTEASEEE